MRCTFSWVYSWSTPVWYLRGICVVSTLACVSALPGCFRTTRRVGSPDLGIPTGMASGTRWDLRKRKTLWHLLLVISCAFWKSEIKLSNYAGKKVRPVKPTCKATRAYMNIVCRHKDTRYKGIVSPALSTRRNLVKPLERRKTDFP